MAVELPGRIQVAGVIDQHDADMIIQAGADMLGFPLGLKDGREDLGVAEAAKIVANTEKTVTSVCITYLDTASEIANLSEALGTRWVQLHAPVRVSEVRKLRARNPNLGIIKSLIIRPDLDGALLDEMKIFESIVDAFITDTFDPETGRSGATGKTHNWKISRSIVESTNLPVILAGGLTHKNVADAIRVAQPAAVDAHTGVERPDGFKSQRLVSRFVKAALAAL